MPQKWGDGPRPDATLEDKVKRLLEREGIYSPYEGTNSSYFASYDAIGGILAVSYRQDYQRFMEIYRQNARKKVHLKFRDDRVERARESIKQKWEPLLGEDFDVNEIAELSPQDDVWRMAAEKEVKLLSEKWGIGQQALAREMTANIVGGDYMGTPQVVREYNLKTMPGAVRKVHEALAAVMPDKTGDILPDYLRLQIGNTGIWISPLEYYPIGRYRRAFIRANRYRKKDWEKRLSKPIR